METVGIICILIMLIIIAFGIDIIRQDIKKLVEQLKNK